MEKRIEKSCCGLYKKRLTAFTLTELVITIIVITLVVMVTLPLTRKKMDKIDYFSYYMAYTTMQDISSNIISQTTYDIDDIAWGGNSVNTLGFKYFSAAVGATSCAACYEYNYVLGKCVQVAEYEKCMKPVLDDEERQCNLKVNYEWDPFNKVCRKIEVLQIPCEGGTVVGGECTCPQGKILTDGKCESIIPGGGFEPVCLVEGANEDCECPEGTTLERNKCVALAESSNTAEEFCEKIASLYNISNKSCSEPVSNVVQAAADGDFSSLTPHITLTNGLRLYLASDLAAVSQLSDTAAKEDRVGYTVYVDANGKSGKNMLYKDIFPFYLLVSGKVVPGYDSDIVAGPINRDNLSVNVLYDDYSNSKREVKFLLKDANFRRAACATGYVTSTEYCKNKDNSVIPQYEVCKDYTHDCRFQVKKIVKIF